MRLNTFKKHGASVGGSSFTGGTLTGPLILAGNPTQPLEAATKQYVDNGLAALSANNLTSGTIPVARLPAFTGDISSNAGTNTLTLSNTGVTVGTYTKVTVDAKGRVTAGGVLAASDIPNLDWSKITTGKPTTLSGYGITDGVNKSGDTMTGPLTLSGNATSPLHAVPLQQLNEIGSGKISKSGDSLTGPLILSGNATSPLHAVPLQQLNEVAFSGNALEFIATGTIPSAGLTVGLNANGTVSIITGSGQPESWGSPAIFNNGSADLISAVYDSTNNKIVIAYVASNQGRAVVGTISGTSISFGTPVTFISDFFIDYVSAAYDSANQKVVIVYSSSPPGYCTEGFGCFVGYSHTAIVGTVSGNNISFGSPVTFSSGTINPASLSELANGGYQKVVYSSANQKVVIVYARHLQYRIDSEFSAHNTYLSAIVGTVSGNSISFGSPIDIDSSSGVNNSFSVLEFFYTLSAVYDPINQKVIIAYGRYSVYYPHDYPAKGIYIIGTVSGNNISFGAKVVFSYNYIDHISAAYDSINNKVILAYGTQYSVLNSGSSNSGSAIVGTVSGNSISFGSPVVFSSATISWVSAVYSSVNNRVVIAYRANNGHGAAIVGTVSGNSISFGSPVVFNSTNTSWTSVVYNSIDNKVVIAYNNNNQHGSAIVYSPSTLATNKNTFIGISQNSAASGTAVKVKVRGQIDSNQSGLTPGQLYYVADNGTLTTTSAGNPLVGRALSATKLLITNWAIN